MFAIGNDIVWVIYSRPLDKRLEERAILATNLQVNPFISLGVLVLKVLQNNILCVFILFHENGRIKQFIAKKCSMILLLLSM